MILVTGSTGHLGNVLIKQLLEKGESIRALILPGEDETSIKDLQIDKIYGTVLDTDLLDIALQNIDTVYHLAGIISIAPGQENIMEAVNVQGVANVADAAIKNGVRRMVHVSSIHAFEHMPMDSVIDENTPLKIAQFNETLLYDHTKALGVQVLMERVDKGLDAISVHPTGIIGPFDYKRSLMGNVMKSWLQKRMHFVVDGAYDFVDVRDVAQSLQLAAEKGKTGEKYICSGNRIDVPSLLRMVQEVVKIKAPHITFSIDQLIPIVNFSQHFYKLVNKTPKFTSYSLDTLRQNSFFNRSKAEKELGYHPRPISQTIIDTVQWWIKPTEAQATK